MTAQLLFDPVIQVAILCGILGIGLLGSLTLWISAKIDARAFRKEFASFRVATETVIGELKTRIDELQQAPPAELLAPVSMVPSNSMTVQGLNLTNRTKALRMHGRGESISSIAGSLGVQQEEIHLLLKMDRLLEVTSG